MPLISTGRSETRAGADLAASELRVARQVVSKQVPLFARLAAQRQGVCVYTEAIRCLLLRH